MGFKDLPIRAILFILAVVFMVYGVFPVMTDVIAGFMGSDNANCPGFVDALSLHSYNSSAVTYGTAGSCVLASIFSGLVMVLFFIGAIYYLIYGDGGTPETN